jgi:NAD(P)-dependent dehydrogenase (short-subunit alcohol dehydrogenase family)
MNVAPGYIVTDLNADAMAEGGPLRAYLDKRIPGRAPGKAADVARAGGLSLLRPVPL